jgi:hypothetical protein
MGKLILYGLLALMLLVTLVSANSGLDQLGSFKNYMNISQANQTYKFEMITDDVGTVTNRVAFANLDDDPELEMILNEYSGFINIWDFDDWKTGRRTARSGVDLGTFHLSSADGEWAVGKNIGIDCIDNDEDGYCEFATNDYDGYLRVSEYDYDAKTITRIWYDTVDRGNYRSSATWCDLDGDGKYEIITCEYSPQICYYWNYTDAITYTLIDTYDTPGSTIGHYNTYPNCGDVDNDGDNDIIVPSYEGKLHWVNLTNGLLNEVWVSADKGTYYSNPMIGDFNGDGTNYIYAHTTDGISHIWNFSSGIGVLMDDSNDIGSTSYCNGMPIMRKKNGKDVIFSSETSGQSFVAEFNESVLTATQFGQYLTPSYIQIGVANTTVNQYEHVLRGGRYGALVTTARWLNDAEYDLTGLQADFVKRFYPPDTYDSGFLYCGGFNCGQFNPNTPEDECIIFDYGGLGFMFTLQNETEYKVDTITDNTIALLDIMPSDAIQYLPEGENRTYCINENKNILLYALGGSGITPWATLKDDDGTIISNQERLTNGLITTYVTPYHQNSADRITFDAGSNQGFVLSLNKSTQMGGIKITGWFADEYDPRNLSVEIASKECDNSPVYTVLFNEQDGDISGTYSIEGLTLRFIPQNVQCIRINASGANYAFTASTTANYMVELEGYYANDCTFYYVPLNNLSANIHEDYNILQRIDLLNSPRNWDADVINPVRDWVTTIAKVIDQAILWLKTN